MEPPGTEENPRASFVFTLSLTLYVASFWMPVQLVGPELSYGWEAAYLAACLAPFGLLALLGGLLGGAADWFSVLLVAGTLANALAVLIALRLLMGSRASLLARIQLGLVVSISLSFSLAPTEVSPGAAIWLIALGGMAAAMLASPVRLVRKPLHLSLIAGVVAGLSVLTWSLT